jgi:hypothetical protein
MTMQVPLVVVDDDHGARRPGLAGADAAPPPGRWHHAALAEALSRHRGEPVPVRSEPTPADAGAVIIVGPAMLDAALALSPDQAARTVAVAIPRPKAPALAQSLALAAVIDDVQYRGWLSPHSRSRTRFYGRREIAARMGAEAVPAPNAPDYVLLHRPDCPDLPSLLWAYLAELAHVTS